MGSSPTGATNLCELLVPLSKALYSNCSVVRRSRKAVGPVCMYLNINTSVHVKERHRLFEKSRGSSRYCWLYFKNTFIYSRTRGKVQLVCTQCVNTQAYEVSINNGRRRRRSAYKDKLTITVPVSMVSLSQVTVLCSRVWDETVRPGIAHYFAFNVSGWLTGPKSSGQAGETVVTNL